MRTTKKVSKMQAQEAWWGTYDLEQDQTAHWQIGPLRMWLHRSSLEWRFTHDWGGDDNGSEWLHEPAASWPADVAEIERFAVTETTGGVHLRPLPSDRPVIARPKTTLRVLPGQRSRVYMSSPLWVEILAGASRARLLELPTKRLSESWFGATTREGVVSYALKTSARTQLSEMPRARYRLLTPVVIENQASDALLLERLSLPVPYVTVFEAQNGEAWSNEIRMLRTETGDMAALDVRSGPPIEAEGGTALSRPRATAPQGQIFRAFGSLLGFD